tara:strand:- start:349 stop:477 length:129 start_codon:yes stop_codon:yes gene_type:complete
MTLASKRRAKNRKRSSEHDGKFFLYVAFHSVFTAIANLFTDD